MSNSAGSGTRQTPTKDDARLRLGAAATIVGVGSALSWAALAWLVATIVF